MIPKKFFGLTSREVLYKVKQVLGNDALIVSNRPIAGGIEVMALAAEAIGDNAAEHAAATPAADGIVPQLMRELGEMKALFKRELSGIAWDSLKQRCPARAAMVQALLEQGFSAVLARELVSGVEEQSSFAEAREIVNDAIQSRLPLMAYEAVVEEGGVYALVGLTGVGKTTTIAKLAARCVVRHGPASVALLTTDSYRIAAHDQLRIYGNILDVPVHAIKDAADLKATLNELRARKTILIDTIGMSQRDPLVAEQSALLKGGGPHVQHLLLLNATANAGTLEQVVSAYAADGADGCIITKIDEAASVATVLDSAMRHRLQLYYVTDGQRVPEDVHVPSSAELMRGLLPPAADDDWHRVEPAVYPRALTRAQGAVHA